MDANLKTYILDTHEDASFQARDIICPFNDMTPKTVATRQRPGKEAEVSKRTHNNRSTEKHGSGRTVQIHTLSHSDDSSVALASASGEKFPSARSPAESNKSIQEPGLRLAYSERSGVETLTSNPDLRGSKTREAQALNRKSTISLLQLHHLETNVDECLNGIEGLVRKQDRVLVLRTELEYARKNLEQLGRFLDESGQNAPQACVHPTFANDQRLLTDRTSPTPDTLQHRANFFDEMARVRTMEDTVNSKERSLLTHERDCLMKISAFKHALQSRIPAQQETQQRRESNSLSVAESSSSKDSTLSNVPSILRQYWNKAGDVGNLHEHLSDMPYEHAEELTRRDLKEDQGGIFETSREALQEQQECSLRSLEDQIRISMRSADILRQRCLDAGLDPEPRRRQSSEALGATPTSARSPSQITSSGQLQTYLPERGRPRIMQLSDMAVIRRNGAFYPYGAVLTSLTLDRTKEWVRHLPEETIQERREISRTGLRMPFRPRGSSLPPRLFRDTEFDFPVSLGIEQI